MSVLIVKAVRFFNNLIDHLDRGAEQPSRSDYRSIKMCRYQISINNVFIRTTYLTINYINQRDIIFVDTRYGSN